MHFAVNIPIIFRSQFSFLEVLLKSIGLYQVVYFVFKKAAKPLGSRDKKYWLDIISNLFYGGFVLNILFLINLEIKFSSVYKMDDTLWETLFEFDKVTCSDFFWIFNSLYEVIQTIIFYSVVKKIEEQIMIQISNEM